MKKFNIFILSIFLIAANNKSINLRDLIKKLEEKDKQINKLKAEYTQIINFKDFNEIYKIEANFIYMVPDKLKIEITSPFKQVIFLKEEKLFVKDLQTNTIYYSNTEDFFLKQQRNYFPLIFSKKNYNLSEFIKKMGFKLEGEEDNMFLLSSRYINGKIYKGKDQKLKPNEIRFLLWIDKETLFPSKIQMVSAKYFVETQFTNFETDFIIDESVFEIEKDSSTKFIEIK